MQLKKHKRKNKEKKEAKEKRLAPGRVKISTYDVDNEKSIGRYKLRNFQPNFRTF